MQSMPDPEDLDALRARVGNDPEKIAKLEAYLRLLALLDEDLDEGDDMERLDNLRSRIDDARRELDA